MTNPARGSDRLFKVCPPRRNWRFEPTTFWRSADWESSTTRPRDGYVEERLLYAGDFDEITIHLFPRVHTLRLRASDADDEICSRLGLTGAAGVAGFIFFEAQHASVLQAFRPTIYHFVRGGFEQVRRGEYVSREPRRAIAVETMPLAEALRRWRVRQCPVDCLADVADALRGSGAYFDEQT